MLISNKDGKFVENFFVSSEYYNIGGFFSYIGNKSLCLVKVERQIKVRCKLTKFAGSVLLWFKFSKVTFSNVSHGSSLAFPTFRG